MARGCVDPWDCSDVEKKTRELQKMRLGARGQGGDTPGRAGGSAPHRRNSKRKTPAGMREARSSAKRKLTGPGQSE